MLRSTHGKRSFPDSWENFTGVGVHAEVQVRLFSSPASFHQSGKKLILIRIFWDSLLACWFQRKVPPIYPSGSVVSSWRSTLAALHPMLADRKELDLIISPWTALLYSHWRPEPEVEEPLAEKIYVKPWADPSMIPLLGSQQSEEKFDYFIQLRNWCVGVSREIQRGK